MRGKGQGVLHFISPFRITPAYAGKSDSKVLGTRNAEDHPRLCGEKVASTFSLLIVRGSPPPMRGKELALRASWKCLRITPAYAGKSIHSCHPLSMI